MTTNSGKKITKSPKGTLATIINKVIFTYADVNAFPRLYNDVAIVWKGLPANIDSSAGGTSFDLLVGYHDKRKLDGIVAVRAPFELRLPPDRPVEVLAKVKAIAEGFILECVAVHEL